RRRVSASFHCGSPATITGCVGSTGRVPLSAARNVATSASKSPAPRKIAGSMAMKKWPMSMPTGFFVWSGSVMSVAPDRQDARVDVHHHCKAVAFVARILGRAAERSQEAALLPGHQRIVGGTAFAVQHPAIRSGELLVRLVADTARRDRRRRHIEQERYAV